jgi:hypothetical protein
MRFSSGRMCVRVSGPSPFAGLGAAAIPRANVRRDLLLGEVAHRLAEQIVLLGEEHIVVGGEIHKGYSLSFEF